MVTPALVNPVTIPWTPATGLPGAKKPSPWPFLGLLSYVFSQVYLLPVAMIGPKWPVWPLFADAAWALFMFFAIVSGKPSVPAPASSKKLFTMMAWMYLACLTSFVVLTLGLSSLEGRKGYTDGAYYLYRLMQFFGLFWATSRVPLTEHRVKVLRCSVLAVFLVSATICLLSWAHVITGPMLAGHLSPSADVSGPWFAFPRDDVRGLGAIGYNHAYTSAQLILLVAWIMSLRRGRRSYVDVVLIVLALAACFGSHSRAGLAAMALYAMAMFLRNPAYVPITGVLLVIGYFSVSPERLASPDVNRSVEASSEILDPLGSRQFRARMQIWDAWSDVIQKNPSTLVTGAGFGASRDVAMVAHMLYLTVLAELGIIGLVVYLYFLYCGARSLWEIEYQPKPLFWATVALLFASTTQETFYPTSAFGHFIGLYLVAAATVLRYADFRLANPRQAVARVVPGFAMPIAGR